MKLGAHQSISGGKYKAIERGVEIDCKSIQIFVKSNRMWKAGKLTEKDIMKFKQTRKLHEDQVTSIFCHGTYLVNLAAEDQEILDKSMTCFNVEWDYCTKLALDYLIFHPGAPKSMGREAGIKQIATSLNELAKQHSKSPVKILLENTAGQGSTIGKTFAELRAILELIEEPSRFGVCFDTCHAFAAGYDIRTEKKYDKVINELDDEVGIDRILAFHINDSKYELGTNHDRHEHIGEGFIGLDGFKPLITDERFKDHPGTLETPDTDKYPDDLQKLRSLVT